MRKAIMAASMVSFLLLASPAPSQEPSSEPPAPSTDSETSPIASILEGLSILDLSSAETPASPFEPPGRPSDRPIGSPPGRNDPPNPPARPDDRPGGPPA